MDKDAQVEQFMMGLATAIEGVSKAYNMPRYPVLVAVVVKPDHVELMANYKSDVTFSSKVVRQVDELIAHSILNHGEIGPSFEVKEG